MSEGKKPLSSIYPEAAIDTIGIGRVEALLTPEVLVKRQLMGIPLVLPLIKEKISNDTLSDLIMRSINEVELDCGTSVQPTIRREKICYQREDFRNWVYLQFPYKPIIKLLSLSISSSNYNNNSTSNMQYPSGDKFFEFPLEWVESSGFKKGIINIIPLMPALAASSSTSALSASGAAALYFISESTSYVPAFYQIEAMVGFCDENGMVPVIVNEMIGLKAATMVIDNLIPQYNMVSASLGIDGMSQSQSNNLSQFLSQIKQSYEEKYAKIVEKIKTITGNKFLTGVL